MVRGAALVRTAAVVFFAAALLARPVLGQSPCAFSVTPAILNIGNQTFAGSISVTPTSGGFCSGWSAAVDPGVTWLHITSGNAGNGPGAVNFTADANPIILDRKATMTVAGTQVLVIQSANTCTFAVSPTTGSYTVSGGSGSVQVTANCFWQSASSDGSWIGVPGASSNGNGTVKYNIAPNGCVTGRSGAVIIQTGLATSPS